MILSTLMELLWLISSERLSPITEGAKYLIVHRHGGSVSFANSIKAVENIPAADRRHLPQDLHHSEQVPQAIPGQLCVARA